MAQVLIGRTLDVLRRLVRDRGGGPALEFALIAMPLCLVIFGTMEFGRMVWTESSLTFAVEAAARCAAVTPTVCGTSSETATYAAGLTATGVPAADFTGSSPTCGHQVSVSYPYQFIATGLFTVAPTLSASACYP